MRKIRPVIKILLTLFLLMAISVFIYAIFTEDTDSEAHIGNLGIKEIGYGWVLEADDGTVINDITLPYSSKANHSSVRLSNKLPSDIRSGMHLCFRSTRQDVIIYINGQVRADYRAGNFYFRHRSPVSAFVLCDLYDRDANGTVTIEIASQSGNLPKYSTVSYAYGNNIWFPYIWRGLPIVSAAIASIIAGLCSVTGYFIIRKKISNSKAVLYLAELIIVMGLWILSESQIRQLYFRAPSLSNIFSFILIETVAAFGGMYFNEVQEHRYEKVYIGFEAVILFQVLLNTILNFTGVADYYDTLIFSHSLTGLMLLWCLYTIITDIRRKMISRYAITAWGMLLLIVSCVLELVNFYFISAFDLGAFLSAGLIILLGATIIQTIVNTLRRTREQLQYSEKMTMMTFRTIASTIDAKDQYTGGHSERVGNYAGQILARMIEKHCPEAADLTEKDIKRIRYIGKMHDIGKIGVPDRVLNKNGKLTDEEYEIMKSHTIIGSDIIGNMDTVEGLRDGVRHHHERFDGSGYPDGLKGRDISLFARILCLADCYDAMTTDRVYRTRLTEERVVEEIVKNKGRQFDPDIADILLDMISTGTLEE